MLGEQKMLTMHTIDGIHKSHKAPVPYPNMRHSEQKRVHLCFEWLIVGVATGVVGFVRL